MVLGDEDEAGYNPVLPLSLFQGWVTFPLSSLGLAAGSPVPPADFLHGAVLEEEVPFHIIVLPSL